MKSKDFWIGVDAGTSALKGLLVSAGGKIHGLAQCPLRYNSPAPGRREVDAEVYYRALLAVLRDCARHVPPHGRVRALSMAAASGNTLLLDKHNQPLTPIVSWMDARAVGQRADTLPAFDSESHYAISGWPLSDGFPLAILAWWRRHHPSVFAAARRYCMNSDYLFYRLTGRWGMDPSTATTFYLADQMQGGWHRPTLRALGISSGKLARISPSGTPLGSLTAAAAQASGLPQDTLVVLGAFDHPCAARAAGVCNPGEVLLSCGTSWVGFHALNDREQALRARLLIDPFLYPPGPWGGMFSLPYVGQTVEWYAARALKRSGAGEAHPWAAFDALAAVAPPGAGGLQLQPFYDRVRNRPVGRLRFPTGTDPACIARAVMEGVVFEIRRAFERYRPYGLRPERLTMVGGPSESAVWPQLVSDITGLRLRLMPNGRHAGALGAALLAGLGAGTYRDLAHGIRALRGTLRELRPDPACRKAYQPIYARYLETWPGTRPR